MTAAKTPPIPRPDSGLATSDGWIALTLVALAMLPFGVCLGGDFVYDDRHQIVGNHLIQDKAYLGQALTSDVWAFKGQRKAAWSNYWRPTFVLWLTLQHRLFGLTSTLGWHLSSLALHALVCLLAYALLRRLELGRGAAATVAGLFAVHPVHVESVAWISGSPDLLAAAAMLGALLAIPVGSGPHRWLRWSTALLLAAVALGAKEYSVMLPVLVAILSRLRGSPSKRRAALTTLPFATLAVLYLLGRWWVLGTVELETPWSLGLLGMAANVPALLAFYLRQSLLPLELGPSYPLRAIQLSEISWSNFWLPLLGLLLIAGGTLALARRRPLVWMAGALFALPLLPALNIDAFIQEQLVHDRYLYLPLLGLLAILAIAWQQLLPSLSSAAARRWRWLAAAVMISLSWQTCLYARAWTSELALWSRAIEVDPGSAFNYTEYGGALLQAGRLEEARSALDRAIEIEAVTVAFLQRADLAMRQGRLADAERDLTLVQRHLPADPRPYRRLAQLQQATGRSAEAQHTLRQGRRQAPQRWCAMSADLAVLLYLANDRAAALEELEACRSRLDQEPTAPCLRGLLRLASLYREQGREEAARGAFAELARRTSGQRPAAVIALHKQALKALGDSP